MDKAFPGIFLGVNLCALVLEAPVFKEILHHVQRQADVRIPKEGGDVVEHGTTTGTLVIHKNDFGIGADHDVLALEITMHQDLGLCIHGHRQEGLEILDAIRYFGYPLNTFQVVVRKVIGLPLERGEVKTTEP